MIIWCLGRLTLAQAVFNTIIKLSEDQMEHQKYNANYLKVSKKDKEFIFKNKFIDCKEQNIYLDEDIREFFFDDGIKKSFWKNLKESILLEPNFNGIGIDLKKLFQK